MSLNEAVCRLDAAYDRAACRAGNVRRHFGLTRSAVPPCGDGASDQGDSTDSDVTLVPSCRLSFSSDDDVTITAESVAGDVDDDEGGHSLEEAGCDVDRTRVGESATLPVVTTRASTDSIDETASIARVCTEVRQQVPLPTRWEFDPPGSCDTQLVHAALVNMQMNDDISSRSHTDRKTPPHAYYNKVAILKGRSHTQSGICDNWRRDLQQASDSCQSGRHADIIDHTRCRHIDSVRCPAAASVDKVAISDGIDCPLGCSDIIARNAVTKTSIQRDSGDTASAVPYNIAVGDYGRTSCDLDAIVASDLASCHPATRGDTVPLSQGITRLAVSPPPLATRSGCIANDSRCGRRQGERSATSGLNDGPLMTGMDSMGVNDRPVEYNIRSDNSIRCALTANANRPESSEANRQQRPLYANRRVIESTNKTGQAPHDCTLNTGNPRTTCDGVPTWWEKCQNFTSAEYTLTSSDSADSRATIDNSCDDYRYINHDILYSNDATKNSILPQEAVGCFPSEAADLSYNTGTAGCTSTAVVEQDGISRATDVKLQQVIDLIKSYCSEDDNAPDVSRVDHRDVDRRYACHLGARPEPLTTSGGACVNTALATCTAKLRRSGTVAGRSDIAQTDDPVLLSSSLANACAVGDEVYVAVARATARAAAVASVNALALGLCAGREPATAEDELTIEVSTSCVVKRASGGGISVRPDWVRPVPVRPGSVRPGCVQPGSAQPGSVQPGSLRPGSTHPWCVQPGFVQPGCVRPNSAGPGCVRPDPVRPGWVQPGCVKPADNNWSDRFTLNTRASTQSVIERAESLTALTSTVDMHVWRRVTEPAGLPVSTGELNASGNDPSPHRQPTRPISDVSDAEAAGTSGWIGADVDVASAQAGRLTGMEDVGTCRRERPAPAATKPRQVRTRIITTPTASRLQRDSTRHTPPEGASSASASPVPAVTSVRRTTIGVEPLYCDTHPPERTNNQTNAIAGLQLDVGDDLIDDLEKHVIHDSGRRATVCECDVGGLDSRDERGGMSPSWLPVVDTEDTLLSTGRQDGRSDDRAQTMMTSMIEWPRGQSPDSVCGGPDASSAGSHDAGSSHTASRSLRPARSLSTLPSLFFADSRSYTSLLETDLDTGAYRETPLIHETDLDHADARSRLSMPGTAEPTRLADGPGAHRSLLSLRPAAPPTDTSLSENELRVRRSLSKLSTPVWSANIAKYHAPGVVSTATCRSTPNIARTSNRHVVIRHRVRPPLVARAPPPARPFELPSSRQRTEPSRLRPIVSRLSQPPSTADTPQRLTARDAYLRLKQRLDEKERRAAVTSDGPRDGGDRGGVGASSTECAGNRSASPVATHSCACVHVVHNNTTGEIIETSGAAVVDGRAANSRLPTVASTGRADSEREGAKESSYRRADSARKGTREASERRADSAREELKEASERRADSAREELIEASERRADSAREELIEASESRADSAREELIETSDRRADSGQEEAMDASSESLDEDNVTVRCKLATCRREARLCDARQTYKTCHSCYTYYCSRECRRDHWPRHKDTCVCSRVGSTCKRVIRAVHDDVTLSECASRVARDGFLAHGRGFVAVEFASLEEAEAALAGDRTGDRLGGKAGDMLGDSWTYVAGSSTSHSSELRAACRAYNPQLKYVVSVSVGVAGRPAGRRAVEKCAKLRLTTGGVAAAAAAAATATRDHDTLILTAVPGAEFSENLESLAARQVCFVNIQRRLRERGVSLRHHYPHVYGQLCAYVTDNEFFEPITLFPVDARGRRFMCLIMPNSEPDVDWLDAARQPGQVGLSTAV